MHKLYTVSGKVIKGKQRGRSLGFPTINIPLTEHIPAGVYASKVCIQGVWHIGATFIGEVKTYNETDYKLECYVLDFDQDIYDEDVTIHLYKHLRTNEKFASPSELVTQIKKDVQQIKDFFEEQS